MMQQTNNNQLIEAAHLAAKYLPPASAQLMVELATRLDVQTILRNEERAAIELPEIITQASAPEVFEIAAEVERLGLRGAYGAYATGWNACREAMQVMLREGKAGEVVSE